MHGRVKQFLVLGPVSDMCVCVLCVLCVLLALDYLQGNAGFHTLISSLMKF